MYVCMYASMYRDVCGVRERFCVFTITSLSLRGFEARRIDRVGCGDVFLPVRAVLEPEPLRRAAPAGVKAKAQQEGHPEGEEEE